MIIQIINVEEKEKLEKESTMKIMKRLREERDEIVEINRLTSDDIRAFTRSAKAKEALQDDIDWTTIIAPSAAVRRRTWCHDT